MAIYHQHLRGGGATQVVLHLVNALLAAGYTVDLVVNEAVGDYRGRLPAGVQLVELSRSSQVRARAHMLIAARSDRQLLARSVFVGRKQLDKMLYLPSLTRYLRRRRPALLLSNLWQLGLAALTARAIATPTTRVACVFHSAYFHECAQRLAAANRPAKWHHFLNYCSRTFARAEALITVSAGIADDLAHTLALPAERIHTIYNPVIDQAAGRNLPAAPDHSWFHARREMPVVVALGRLSPEKRYDHMLQAMAALQSRRPTRLVILGEGPERRALEQQIAALGLKGRVDLPGWVSEPASWLCHANAYALTSRTEGLPLSMLEALACGCPVVSYDCPHGPREILAHGTFGRLVAPGDITGLASALEQTLSAHADRLRLIERSETFSISTGVAHYLSLVSELLKNSPSATVIPTRPSDRKLVPMSTKRLLR